MKVNNRIDMGESHLQNTFGHNFNIKPFTGEQWNIRKEPPKQQTSSGRKHRLQDRRRNKLKELRGEGMLYGVIPNRFLRLTMSIKL